MGQQKERSGTPLETRGAAQQGGMAAEQFLRFLTGGGGQDVRKNILGFDVNSLGVGGVAADLLRSPEDQTAGLFAALRPIEQRTTREQVAGLREMFGTQGGGRGSTDLLRSEGNLRAQLAQGFGLNRQNALLQANQQRSQALMQLLGLSNAAAQPFFDLARPGEPVFEPSTGQQVAQGGVDLGSAVIALLLGG